MKILPDFVIIGAQKSGSTFLLKSLREHPDIFMPAGETRFFEDPEYLQTDFRQFEALFERIPQSKIIGIKRPDYLGKVECAGRIHQHLPQAKLVVILRNPVERAKSAYFYQMRQNFIPIKPVEEGLNKIINGEYRDLYPKSQEIIEYGFYYRHLRRYLNYFDKHQMLIMRFKAIKTDPGAALKQLYRFVGVDEAYHPRSLEMKSQHNSGVYALPRLRLLTLSNAMLFTYNHDRTRRYRKRPAPPLARLLNKTTLSIDHLILTPIYGNPKPALSPTLAQRLYQMYKEDINRLEDFLGEKLTSWKLSAANASFPTNIPLICSNR